MAKLFRYNHPYTHTHPTSPLVTNTYIMLYWHLSLLKWRSNSHTQYTHTHTHTHTWQLWLHVEACVSLLISYVETHLLYRSVHFHRSFISALLVAVYGIVLQHATHNITTGLEIAVVFSTPCVLFQVQYWNEYENDVSNFFCLNGIRDLNLSYTWCNIVKHVLFRLFLSQYIKLL